MAMGEENVNVLVSECPMDSFEGWLNSVDESAACKADDPDEEGGL